MRLLVASLTRWCGAAFCVATIAGVARPQLNDRPLVIEARHVGGSPAQVPGRDAQTADVLAAMSRHISFSIGCHCEDATSRNRSLLGKLLSDRDARVL